VTPEDARSRLAALGFREQDVEVLARHFLDAEQRGRQGHGVRRIEWLETWKELPVDARPERVVRDAGYERWDGGGALGYLVLDAIVEAQLAEPPQPARLVVAGRTFPTGMLGHWTRRLAEGGLVAAMTATSPRRLGHPDGGAKLTGTNPLSIAIPSSDGRPVVADVSMGNLTYGDVLAGRATEDELAPFGGELAHKAFALAVGLQLLVDALIPAPAPAAPVLPGGSVEPTPRPADRFGALLLVARPEADPVPAFRELAAGARLPGDH
jgi:LDH2 family malate/lactate/ureidoglycolate dehydrogenase